MLYEKINKSERCFILAWEKKDYFTIVCLLFFLNEFSIPYNYSYKHNLRNILFDSIVFFNPSRTYIIAFYSDTLIFYN